MMTVTLIVSDDSSGERKSIERTWGALELWQTFNPIQTIHSEMADMIRSLEQYKTAEEPAK